MKYSLYTILLLSLITLSCQQNDKVIPQPEIFMSMPEEGFDIDKDSSFIIIPKITYDIASTYEWKLNEETLLSKKDFTFENYSLGTYNFHFSVTTPYGSDTMIIPVHSLDIFTFEKYEEFNDDNYNNNAEDGAFQFDYVSYSNTPASTSEAWSGFAISKKTNKTNASVENEFSVYDKSGAESSKNFMVFKQSETIDHQITFSDGNAHTIKSIEVNNTTYAYLQMQGGGIFDKKNNKDYYCLTITGYDETGNTAGSVDFYLADYRNESFSKKYLVASWHTVDLTSLGEVHALGFKLTSSTDASEDKFIPKYFCLDNLKIKS